MSKIINAIYGTDSKYINVTRLLNDKINNNETIIHINNNSMGSDPYIMKKKILIITYYNNTIFTISENDKLYTHFITNKINNDSYGFIILRCVKKYEHDLYWKECYKCIRKFYNQKIIIIDDNSNKLFLKKMPLVNTIIIQSEFPGRAELLPYYYFYKLKPFNKAIILHDTMFIQKKINFLDIVDIKFIWHFPEHNCDEVPIENNFISQLNNNHKLKEFYDNKNWYGCFGLGTIIDYNFIKYLQDKYNIFNILNFINNKHDRMALERIFGLLSFFENKLTFNNCSLLNSIHHHIMAFKLTYVEYIKIKNTFDYPIIKIWSGR